LQFQKRRLGDEFKEDKGGGTVEWEYTGWWRKVGGNKANMHCVPAWGRWESALSTCQRYLLLGGAHINPCFITIKQLVHYCTVHWVMAVSCFLKKGTSLSTVA
jgi:hypothetical protein